MTDISTLPTTDGAPENLDPMVISQIQFHRARAHMAGMKRGLIEFFEVPKRTITVV